MRKGESLLRDWPSRSDTQILDFVLSLGVPNNI